MNAAQIKLAEQENPELSNSHFAARLRTLRLARNITPSQLAELCGWSQSKLDNYEDAKEEPSFSDINLLSKSLGVLPAYLLFG